MHAFATTRHIDLSTAKRVVSPYPQCPNEQLLRSCLMQCACAACLYVVQRAEQVHELMTCQAGCWLRPECKARGRRLCSYGPCERTLCSPTPVLPKNVRAESCVSSRGETKRMNRRSRPERRAADCCILSRINLPAPHFSSPFQSTPCHPAPLPMPVCMWRKLLAATVSRAGASAAWQSWEAGDCHQISSQCFPHTAERPPAGARLQ